MENLICESMENSFDESVEQLLKVLIGKNVKPPKITAKEKEITEILKKNLSERDYKMFFKLLSSKNNIIKQLSVYYFNMGLCRGLQLAESLCK